MKSKKTNKKTAIIVVLTIIIAIAAVFSFVPMKFGNTTYTGVWGAINVSSDLNGGMYAEYEISGDASSSEIISSMAKIKSVLQEEGYQSCNVYSLDNKKIRVEIGYPQTVTNTFRSAYSMLKDSVASGSFQLRSSNNSTSSDNSDTVVVTAKDHIKDVSIADYNGTTFLVIKFNKAGEAKFKQLCQASTTIYVYMGSVMQTSFSASNISDYSQMQLSINDYNSAHDFRVKTLFGSIGVELNSLVSHVNTMTSRYNLGAGDGYNTILAVMVSLIFVLIVAGFVLIGIKYKMLAVLLLPLMMLNSIIACWIFAGVSSIEFSFTSLLAIFVGIGILFAGSLGYFGRIAEEYKQGKTFAASIETGTKRARPAMLIANFALFVLSFVLFWFIKGEVASACLILSIISGLNILTNVVMLPWFVNIVAKAYPRQPKRFGLTYGVVEEEKND